MTIMDVSVIDRIILLSQTKELYCICFQFFLARATSAESKEQNCHDNKSFINNTTNYTHKSHTFGNVSQNRNLNTSFN